MVATVADALVKAAEAYKVLSAGKSRAEREQIARDLMAVLVHRLG